MPIILEQQIAAVYREISLRERVYPKMIETGRMTKQKADHELACMKAVVGILMALKAQSNLGGKNVASGGTDFAE